MKIGRREMKFERCEINYESCAVKDGNIKLPFDCAQGDKMDGEVDWIFGLKKAPR
ncbi:hypothetical protein [Flavobacterium sp.]|uniref:hypothetical protein n=1 Tax=Flavobacterium sp. TaxID=239 RepID=UPI0025FD8250|nr:hypothetical protein [Flavobacterium sp.]